MLEFRLRRDRIAVTLFSCKLIRCLGCECVELKVPVEDEDQGLKNGCEFETGGGKESKVNSNRDDQFEMNINQVSNYSYGEAEALADDIEDFPKEEDVRTIIEFVKAPDMFQCDLLDMPVVAQLEKDAKYALVYQLLKIFLTRRYCVHLALILVLILVLLKVSVLFSEWYRIYELSSANVAACAPYVLQLQQSGLLKGDDLSDRFFRCLTVNFLL
ncbi:putative mediator of RNA polymerase II transcription subunit 26b [Camellia lanceoleosa]|uniref:Mediator of RNA polymerase II transcription subunit 26b n=1 Tax=Camellia lanceoleosa TaxID=1840588 RepID=A0ACC0FTN9_9ERIC|nr:putative mediator of RNA polymerase II transcription subunit 26b [Camellia lanceoleosa]